MVVLINTGCNRASKGVSSVRQEKERRMEPEGGPGKHGSYRIGRGSPSVSAGWRALNRAAWWLSGEIGKGETERRVRALYRRGAGMNQTGSKGD
jgi:hypothetical protein